MSENKRIRIDLWQKISLIIFGLFLALTILEIGLRLGGLALSSLQQYRNHLSIKQKSSYRILCIGESTTAYQYPRFLEEVLNRRNIGIKFSVIDGGSGGVNTGYILNNLMTGIDLYHPDMVISMMGINDGGTHMPHEVSSGSKVINYLKSFRIYKLARLLRLHIVTRLRELKFGKPGNCALQPDFLQRQVYTAKTEIKPNLKSDMAYVEKGQFYRKHGRIPDSSINKAVELNPKNHILYIKVGEFYRKQGRLAEAEQLFSKAIELDPADQKAYIGIGVVYQRQGRPREAESAFKKAIELNPQKHLAYVMLGRFYFSQDKFSQAESAFKKAIELNPKSDRTYRALKALYMETGDLRLAREYDLKLKELGLTDHRSMTICNYLKLKAILNRRNITYVCAQYPLRNIGILKKIFRDNSSGIIFVDNEKIFRDALKQTGYKEYFLDMFGGDFGHCTDTGNRLLAENIANVILKEVFGR